jgi:hypothetical protein
MGGGVASERPLCPTVHSSSSGEGRRHEGVETGSRTSLPRLTWPALTAAREMGQEKQMGTGTDCRREERGERQAEGAGGEGEEEVEP